MYHYIENNKLKTNQCYRIVREIQKLRLERRIIKDNTELIRTLNTHQQKLVNEDSRKMLIAELKKTEKRLQSQYNNRIYSEEEIKELIGN